MKVNQELVKKYKKQSFDRWSQNQIDYDKFVLAVVEDCLAIVQTSKPSKTLLTKSIREYFGMEALVEEPTESDL